jgi:hypothetical protein
MVDLLLIALGLSGYVNMKGTKETGDTAVVAGGNL